MASGSQRGAYSVGDKKRKGGAWWRWLLALLALLIAIGILIALLSGGDDDSGSGSGAGSGSQAALTAGGTKLLPLPSGGLQPLVGDTVEGQGVKVQSVVEDEGFWVGTSATDRVYVEYGGEVGENEQQFVPKVGDVVNLSGPIRPAPADPGRTLRLEQADSDLVEEQGGFVNADTVERAQ